MYTRALLFVSAVALLSAGVHSQCTGSVVYRLSNVCNWRGSTHPVDYPSNAHWSPFCGTAHNADYTLFEVGGISTVGVQDVAELGDCTALASEIDTCMMEGYCSPSGSFSYMCDTSLNPEGVGNGVCSHSGSVTVYPEFPYVSGISMVAPSPDWFIGISNVNLCQQDPETGEYYWVDQYPADGGRPLNAYDAGTDSGVSFASPNAPTTPFEPITRFDAMDATNIFYNPTAGMLYPLCQILLEKM